MAGLKLVPVDEGFPTLEIEGGRASVGRTAGVDHIVNDPSVSRQHAVLENRDGVWTVTDKGSANGTFVDGERVASAPIRDGQEVRFGARTFRVHVDWVELPTAFLPQSALPPPRPSPQSAAPPLPAVPPRPVRPTPPPPAAEPELPPTIPPSRIPLGAPPRPPLPARPGRTGETQGLWQDGRMLVMAKGARLPNLCAKCGSRPQTTLRRKLSWHNPLLYFLIPLGVLIYAIVATVVSKKAEVDVPLCAVHKQRRTLLTWIGVGLLVLSILSIILAMATRAGAVAGIAGACFLLAAIIVAIISQNLVTPGRIDDHFVWLKGLHPTLLAGLPPWPGPTPALMGLAADGGVRNPLPPGPPEPTGMAQAALASGVLSIFLCPAPIAVVLGILGILDVRRAPGRVGMGRSIFGLCAGLVGSLVLGAAVINEALRDGKPSTVSGPAPLGTPRPFSTAPPPSPAGVVIAGKNGRMKITAPSGWRAENDLNANADLQACDAPQQVCIVVFQDSKAVTGVVPLARFSRQTRGLVLKKLEGGREGVESALQIGGHPALQYELRGRTANIDFVYLHTSVETPGHYYQVLGWTSSTLFPNEKAVLQDVVASFRP